MSVLPPSLARALEADASLWPGSEDVRARPEVRAALLRELERALAVVPTDVRDVLLSAMVDPVRNDWSRAAVLGLSLAATGGAAATGLANDEVLEMRDARGERFGLVPVGARLPAHPTGPPEAVARLLRGLDGAFGHRRYVLCIRRPLRANLDVAPICSAVQLWLAQRDRHDQRDRHAVYEDEEIALDLTVVDDDPASDRGGRLLTFGPLGSEDRLDAMHEAVRDAVSRTEESLGALPLVVVAAADRPWNLPRGLVQHHLYGLADRTLAGPGTFEADFTPSASARFAHPVFRSVCALWWVEPGPRGALSCRARAHVNPWASTALALRVAAARFAPDDASERWVGRVTLRWSAPARPDPDPSDPRGSAPGPPPGIDPVEPPR